MKKIQSIFPSEKEMDNQKKINQLFKKSPLKDELFQHPFLYMPRQIIMRLLFFRELYQKILNVHGIIIEFGCRWGDNLSLMIALRGIYEPYNHNRKVIGFDTFSGLAGMSEKDGGSPFIGEGFYSTSQGYEAHLEQVLHCMEQECPISHLKKYEIHKGDVRQTLKKYLEANPQTIIALAYFDMDLYEPTKAAMEMIKPYMTKGTVIGLDEMNWDVAPGPTIAFRETFGFDRYKAVHSFMGTANGYAIID